MEHDYFVNHQLVQILRESPHALEIDQWLLAVQHIEAWRELREAEQAHYASSSEDPWQHWQRVVDAKEKLVAMGYTP